jgi:tyrosyl-tRNA synthetase
MRMSKSTGNFIGIDEEPEEMYGKVMSIPDSAMSNYLRLVTRWTPAEVGEIESGLDTGELHPRDVKMRLAREIVEIYHGEAAVGPAEDAFRRVFQDRGTPEDIPEFEVSGTQSIVEIMVAAGLASSKSEAKRLIDQKGVRLDGEVVTDKTFVPELDQSKILKVGKRKFIRLQQR